MVARNFSKAKSASMIASMTVVPPKVPAGAMASILSGAGNMARSSGTATQALGGAAWGAGASAGRSAVNAVVGQDNLKLVFLIIIYGAFHWFIDYGYFNFLNTISRALIHFLFAFFYCTMFLYGDERSSTIKALFAFLCLEYLVSTALYSFLPFVTKYGGAELVAGFILVGFLVQKPEWFSKKTIDNAPIILWILSAYLMPALTGLIGLIGDAPGIDFVQKYLTPFFFPFWLYYFFLGKPANNVTLPVKILIWVILLAFLSPIWLGQAQSVIENQSLNSGVNDAQKDTFLSHLTKASDSFLLFGRTFTDSTVTGVTCAYYDFTNQLGSATGKTGSTTDPKYAICNKKTADEGSDIADFDTSVEQGALSTSSMSLSTIVSAQQKYYQSQDATFLATFKAQSFDTTVFVSPFCTYRASSVKKENADKLEPITQNFTIEGSAQQDIVCTIPAGLKQATSYEVTTGVVFDYVTLAYIPRYFTTSEALDNFKSSGSISASDSMITFYGGNLKPISKSTKGPVKVGVSAENSLIVFAEKNSLVKKEFTVVVTIENQNSWKGKMQEVKAILIALPNGIEIKQKTATVAKPVAPTGVGAITTPTPSWSDYQCTTGAFIGNFEQLSVDQCQAINEASTIDKIELGTFNDLDCTHYNYYFLIPGYGSGKTAIDVATGSEITQKPFVSCQAVATDSSELLAKNSNFATKSIQARVKYAYQLEQSRSFKVEALGIGEQPVFADPVLSKKSFCGNNDAYSLDPNILMAFFQNSQRVTTSAASKTYDQNLGEFNLKLTDAERAILNGGGEGFCPTRSIALAAISQNWKQVQGNPMVSGYSYGYLQANKKMIDYLLGKGIAVGDMTSTTDVRYTDAAQLDLFLKTNSLLVGTTYITALARDDSGCKSATTGNIDYSCVVGKFKCGVGYVPKNYASCTNPSSCQYCEQTTTTDIMTLATQIAQISKTDIGVTASTTVGVVN